MYPNNSIQASKINSTLFSEDVQGRVDLTSTFEGRELNTEVLSHLGLSYNQYIFGLFSTIATTVSPKLFNIVGIPINYTITGFTVDGDQVVASFIFYDMHPGDISLPIETILFLQFNSKGEITEVNSSPSVLDSYSSMMPHSVERNGSSMFCWNNYRRYLLMKPI